MMVLVLMLTACHQDQDELFTTADVTITGYGNMTVNRVQGTVNMTNLSSRQITTSTNFHGATCHMAILRGSYAVDAEGVVSFTDSLGNEQQRQFRAQSNYLPFIDEESNSASLELILMN